MAKTTNITNDNIEHTIRNNYQCDYVVNVLSKTNNNFDYRFDSKVVYDITVGDLCNNVNDVYMFFGDISKRIIQHTEYFEEYIHNLKKRKLYLVDDLILLHNKEINAIKSLTDTLFQKFQNLLGSGTCDEEFENSLIDFYSIYRYLLNKIAYITSAFDWQSISYDSSKRTQVFNYKEIGYKGVLGYKRVHYPELIEYEKDFLDEFIVNNNKELDLVCLMTSSGQGASLTLMGVILNEISNTPKVLLSKNTYYETQVLFAKNKSCTCVFFNEDEEGSIIQQIIDENVDVLLVEPYYCGESISFLDIHSLICKINKIKLQKSIYILIDASMMSGAIQPFSQIISNPNIEIFLFESMVKYREFGLDKVNAGFLVAPKKYLRRLISSRAVTGTILHSADLNLLPRINKCQFDIRMRTIFRNTKYLSQELQDFASANEHLLVSGVEYPGIPQHRHYNRFNDSDYPYLNGIVNIKFDNDYYKNFATMLFFISKIMEDAKSAGLSVAHGTSFGFDYTRLAIADTSGGDFQHPFIRISVGRENFKDIVILSDIIKCNISKYLKY